MPWHSQHCPGPLLAHSAFGKKLLNCLTDVLRDLAEESRRDISAFVHGHCSPAAVSVPELDVSPSLPHRGKIHPLENSANLERLQNRNIAHNYAI